MPIAFDTHLAALRARVRHVSPADLATALGGAVAPLLLDIREPDERAQGAMPQSVAVPRAFLEARIAALVGPTPRPVVVCCESGVRSVLAIDALERLGWTDVASLEGGCAAWRAAALPWHVESHLSDAEYARYARQMRLPEVGERGQQRLRDARVVVVGTGGLGSPVALYLAAAGVGTLVLIDDDQVDLSNLHRQILHDSHALGLHKVDSGAARLRALNPHVQVVTHRGRATEATLDSWIEGADVVVDGTDNFTTRHAINEACVRRGIPNVHGAIHRFDGQVAVFGLGDGPCYRCLHPEPPPPESAPSCAEAGVFGAVCGVIGSMMAAEVLKLLLQLGEPLSGRVLTWDLRSQRGRAMQLVRQPACPTCGPVEGRRPVATIDHGCTSS
jgi:molybdopterin/thiamine biosynthesis adenylyltransferase/rhodanese-related sulfurtransferase